MEQIQEEHQVSVAVTVNGTAFQEVVNARKLLSDFLRENCGFTGTHVGCEHGVCGACTVMLEGRAVRSCLIFAAQVDGYEITTVEGLSVQRTGRVLQETFKDCHALQCGFCTPGILVSATEYLNSSVTVEHRQIEELVSGHLCRCTGYKGIVDAIESAANKLSRGGE